GGRGETVVRRRLLPGVLVLFAALAAPASALALPPEVGTGVIRATTATTATVLGSVSPSSRTTTYEVVYDVSTSEWCESGATLGSPSKETAAQSLGFVDEESHEVAVHLTGLTGGTGYCAAVRAKNVSGLETGFPAPFIAGEPIAQTAEARPTGSTAATVAGFVGPAGQTTTFKVLYDVSASEWCVSEGQVGSPANSTSGQTLGYTDATLHAVAVHLTGLTAGKTYCAALQATNASDTLTATPTRFSVGTPAASDSAFRSTSANTATLE